MTNEIKENMYKEIIKLIEKEKEYTKEKLKTLDNLKNSKNILPIIRKEKLNKINNG